MADRVKPVLYLVGSLRNPEIPGIAQSIRETGIEVFDDWYAAGPEADDWWQKYERFRGHDYPRALRNWSAVNVFEFDKRHLNRSDGGVLVLPAGKSGHLELGYLRGQEKPTYILLDEDPDRFDVMYQFASGGVFYDIEELKVKLKKDFLA